MKNTQPTHAKQQGFTLIELIMVIVILGILSAFALPKFADFSDGARDASVQGALGAIKSGVGIARAQFLVNGSTGTSVTLEGEVIDITNGYPSKNDLVDLADLDGFTVTPGATPATDPVTIHLTGSTALGDPCFTYQDSNGTVAPAISLLLDFDGSAACN